MEKYEQKVGTSIRNITIVQYGMYLIKFKKVMIKVKMWVKQWTKIYNILKRISNNV